MGSALTVLLFYADRQRRYVRGKLINLIADTIEYFALAAAVEDFDESISCKAGTVAAV